MKTLVSTKHSTFPFDNMSAKPEMRNVRKPPQNLLVMASCQGLCEQLRSPFCDTPAEKNTGAAYLALPSTGSITYRT